MTCPVPFETLAAWWAFDLAEADVNALEEHLFSCDACAASAEALGTLVVGLRDWLPPIISPALRDRLVAAGKNIKFTDVEPDVDARARFDPGLDLLIHVLHGDFSGARSVDVEIVTAEGATLTRFDDVPFDAARGEVIVSCQRHYQHLFPGDPRFRVVAHTQSASHEVGRYLVLHEWP